MKINLTILILFILAAGCAREPETKPSPVEFTRDHACRVCGMIIVDFPGAKAQIHYKKGKYDAFCSTLDMFLFHHQPDRPRDITVMYVNDMGKADAARPAGRWIEARGAWYVFGGSVTGPMGESLVPFSEKKDAGAYVGKHGGRIIRFDDVTMDMLKPGRSRSGM